MDLRIAYVIVSCLVLIVSGVYATSNQVQLKGSLCTLVVRASGSEAVGSFVLATLDQDVLDLEFLEAAEGLTIKVWGNDGVCVFNETTDVINGVHIIVDLSVSNAWFFEIYIYDNNGTFISGEFELP